MSGILQFDENEAMHTVTIVAEWRIRPAVRRVLNTIPFKYSEKWGLFKSTFTVYALDEFESDVLKEWASKVISTFKD